MEMQWQHSVEAELGCSIEHLTGVDGGDFARSYKAMLSDKRVIFVKTHDKPPANFFSTEAHGLEWLRKASAVNVPKVLAFSDSPPYLALEWIELGYSKQHTESQFGEQLARLHETEFECFGRPDGRTTGSQAVPNTPCDTWAEFYATRRLLPLAKLAYDRQALNTAAIKDIEKLASKLDLFGAANDKPALLHGDLWAGNRVVDEKGNSWIIDPAAHGGHREFDIAMMLLFGGYDQACIDAYNDTFPLADEWRSRISLHQLAPLIVHAIKFGGSYGASTKQALSHYV